MKLLNKLEQKFGRYAVRNLSAVIIGLYAAGYILSVFSPEILRYLTLEPYYILHGQIWRIVTWIIVPPGALNLFTVIMLFFYYSIGQTLERTWGAFRFNVYILTGLIFTVLGAFILYAIFASQGRLALFGGLFNTFYVNMSIFLAFALSYPEMHVLLYFFIPVKMKWMGVLYGVMILVTFFQSSWVERVAIIASLLNFILFFLMTSGQKGFSFRNFRYKTQQSRAVHKKVTRPAAPAGNRVNPSRTPIHRCAVCGRTELDSDQLVFRYCSKCDGAYEYCQDHLFNHEHKQGSV